MSRLSRGRWPGFVAGMAVTSASLSSGFIWACGTPCIETASLWTPERQVALVFGAALAAWWGYLLAHYAVNGTFVDESAHAEGADRSEAERHRSGRPSVEILGVVVGIAVLVAGMVVGVVYIRRGDHLLTNLGGALFLGGYALAHYVETGKPV